MNIQLLVDGIFFRLQRGLVSDLIHYVATPDFKKALYRDLLSCLSATSPNILVFFLLLYFVYISFILTWLATGQCGQIMNGV